MDMLVKFNQKEEDGQFVEMFLVGKLSDDKLFTGIYYRDGLKRFIYNSLVIPNEDVEGNIIDDETSLSNLLKDSDFVNNCYEKITTILKFKDNTNQMVLKDLDNDLVSYLNFKVHKQPIYTNNSTLTSDDLAFSYMSVYEFKQYSGLVDLIDECSNDDDNDILDGFSFTRNDIAEALQICYRPNGEADIDEAILDLPLHEIEEQIASGEQPIRVLIDYL